METSLDSSKKQLLEDLSKEELIKKCRGLLNILQKAKQSKESLIAENNGLKDKLNSNELTNATTKELLEKLTQQKLELVTKLEDVQSEKDVIYIKLKDCEFNLKATECKLCELDITNQSYQRQVDRLSEDNEQLLVHLDALEKQVEDLKGIGMEQQEQLLKIEKNNVENEKIKLIDSLQMELEEARKSNEKAYGENEELIEKTQELTGNIESLRNDYQKAQLHISDLKTAIREKNEENEGYLGAADDLNIELHKNKALVEKLQQDITTMTNKLSDNQIVSSGVTSDLQNTNDKLRDKVKFYHSKIVKFAGDVKVLRLQKNQVLDDFRTYMEQVKLWEKQLQEFSSLILIKFNEEEKKKAHSTEANESHKLAIEMLENEKLDLIQQNNELKSKIEEYKITLKQEINEYAEKIVLLTQQLDELNVNRNSLQERCNNLEIEVKLLSEETNKMKNEMANNIKENLELTQTLEHNKVELQTQENNCAELNMRNTKLLEESKETSNKLNQCLLEITELTKGKLQLENDLALIKETEAKQLEQVTNEISKLTQENNNLMEINTTLQSRLTTEKIDCVSQTIANEFEELMAMKRENAELLTEMNEMNQVLKERGETISKQQEYCEELLRNVKIFETQATKLTEVLKQKEEVIAKLEHDLSSTEQSVSDSVVNNNEMHETIIKKDEQIKQLENELSVIKEKLNSSHGLDTSQDASYADSETMSTSTISRSEELSRLKDLEGSWEERYGKLRSLALKLKGKIRDMTGELTKEQSEKADVQQKFANSVKATQNLQSQCDKLQDELEQNKGELKECLKKLDNAALEISNSKKQLANNNEVIIKSKSEIELLTKEKQNTENWKKQVSVKVQNLRKELEANNVMKKDFENQIGKLNSQLEVKEKTLRDEMEKHNTTKSSLLESNNECKKQSVLNLEMQDYERSLKDITQKLEKKKELVTKLKNQIDNQKSTVSSVKEQNRLLEERIRNEESDLNAARNEIQAYKKSISDFESFVMQKDNKIQDLTHNLECCRSDNENLSTQLSSVVAESQKINDSIKSDRDYLRGQNLGLEQRLQEVQDSLKIKEDDVVKIQAEYNGYKVRAQSVLRQNQTRDVGLEEKLSEEAASFKAQVAILTTEIKELKSDVEKLKDEKTKLTLEKDQILKKFQDLEHELNEFTNQHDSIVIQHQKTISDHAEAMRGLKVHAETLAQCYRHQLSEQEVRHNREIIELQSKIEKIVPTQEIPPLSPTSLPREQGEGSESIVDTKYQNNHPVPLDRLLSNELDYDINFVKKQLNENEMKVTHLTALLADTEQDLVKHVQMNKLLKEEIRRQQRSVEREKHAENLEYLKNVVFKFATLTSGDERSRLVPVLNTILKFSPEETNKLNLVARGDLGSRGWTNYLPVWPASGKPL